MHMAKARPALLGIICLITMATTSLYALPISQAHIAYPACDKVPSWRITDPEMGYWIDLYDGPQTVSGRSFVKDRYRADGWSTRTSDWQRSWLSGTQVYLFIDGKPTFLMTDICYDKDGSFYRKVPDALYKSWYLIIFPRQYVGDHQFYEIGFWRGWFDLGNEVTVTFS